MNGRPEPSLHIIQGWYKAKHFTPVFCVTAVLCWIESVLVLKSEIKSSVPP